VLLSSKITLPVVLGNLTGALQEHLGSGLIAHPNANPLGILSLGQIATGSENCDCRTGSE
jgi:hypothetical protein